jgi:hypothetical protein
LRQSQHATKDGLQLSILLSQPPKCWDYRCEAILLFLEFFFFLEGAILNSDLKTC